MRRFFAAAAVVAIAASAVVAQAPEMKPGPEHKRIGFFAGQWNFQGEAKASPMGPAGKTSGSETCEWFAGGFQLVCRSKGTSPRGPGTGMSIMSYDPGRKTYTFYAISSMGESFFVRGNVQGKVWTWEDESVMDGKPMKIRATITEETPTSYSYRIEGSMGEGPVTVMEEGKATRVKGA